MLLLAGVTLNAFFSALILFVQYLSDFAQTFRALRWLMGDLDVAGYAPILAALPFVVVAFAAFAWLARPLNLLSLGAEAAGVARRRTWCARSGWRSSARRWRRARPSRSADRSASSASSCRIWCGCSSAPTTGWCCRRRRSSAPRSSSLCDAVARTVLAPLELPVGIITALIGGPFFLWLLIEEAMTSHWQARSRAHRLRLSSLPSRPSLAASRSTSAVRQRRSAGVRSHHLAGPGRHRDAVRDRRGRRGRRRVELRSLSRRRWQTRPRVGALVDPDFERILSLRPDLVVVYGTQNDLIASGSTASTCRSSTIEHAGLADVTQTMRDARQRDRSPASADVRARRIRTQLAAIRQWSPAQPHPRTALSSAGSRQRCAASSRAAASDSCTTCSRAGGADAFGDVQRENLQVSAEMLLARAPEVIVEHRGRTSTGTLTGFTSEVNLWKH